MGQYRRRSYSAGNGIKTKSQFPTVSTHNNKTNYTNHNDQLSSNVILEKRFLIMSLFLEIEKTWGAGRRLHHDYP